MTNESIAWCVILYTLGYWGEFMTTAGSRRWRLISPLTWPATTMFKIGLAMWEWLREESE